MKTILEITPLDETRYEMPDEIYTMVEAVLAWGMFKTTKAAVAALPDEVRGRVRIYLSCKPLAAGPLRGFRADVLMVDDYAFKQEYLNEFCDRVPKE